MKSLSNRKFDETVEAAFKLGVDPRKADQMLRGTVSLPAGTGKDVRVAVFATGDAARDAQEAGADVVGADDLVKRIQDEGFMDFDVAIATPDMMGQVGRLGRVLGPRGLMPNPKTGTVTTDVGKAVSEFKGGKVEYRTDRNGNVHVPIGKVSFPVESLVQNYGAVLDELPAGQARVGEGPLHQGHRDVVDDGPRRQDLARNARGSLTAEAEAGAVRARPERRPRHTGAAERNRLTVAEALHGGPQAVALRDQLDAAVAEHLDEAQRLVAARERDLLAADRSPRLRASPTWSSTAGRGPDRGAAARRMPRRRRC